MKLMTSPILIMLAGLLLSACGPNDMNVQELNAGPRLYIFDNGDIKGLDPALFNFNDAELAETDLIITSNLIVHPKGTLMWEAGGIADKDFPEDGSPATAGPVSAVKTLRAQLEEVGYSPEDIDFFAMSHLHSDHTANANDFAGAQWIVQKADRDMMFSGESPTIMAPESYAALENAATILLDNEDYDVFGDGSVRILSAPGHTPGHQVLWVNLPETGPVILAGDLYHYPEEITMDRFPGFEYDSERSAESRYRIKIFIEETGAQLWIGHDKASHAELNYSPAYYH